MTRTLVRKMSGPVLSPSMKGMTGRSGTISLPPLTEIFWPPGGGVGLGLVGIVMGVGGSGGGKNRARLPQAPGPAQGRGGPAALRAGGTRAANCGTLPRHDESCDAAGDPAFDGWLPHARGVRAARALLADLAGAAGHLAGAGAAGAAGLRAARGGDRALRARNGRRLATPAGLCARRAAAKDPCPGVAQRRRLGARYGSDLCGQWRRSAARRRLALQRLGRVVRELGAR